MARGGQGGIAGGFPLCGGLSGEKYEGKRKSSHLFRAIKASWLPPFSGTEAALERPFVGATLVVARRWATRS